MIGVEEAQARLLALAPPLPSIELPLPQTAGRYLAEPVIARRTQPAADLSAMDGYAVRHADCPGPWRLIGQSAAGRPFVGTVGNGEAVRIFTGAHVPSGADAIVIQENVSRDGDRVLLSVDQTLQAGEHVRRAGGDFAKGDQLLGIGDRLGAGAVAVSAMAGYGAIKVGARPKISIIASGDELVMPGDRCSDAQIPASNSLMLASLLGSIPCDVRDEGIVADTTAALETSFRQCSDADIIVTSGGASVGDHDLVQQALRNVGAHIDFWKVAMRPGKPMMAGRLDRTIVLGLPGNPASAYVTAFLFLLPLIRHLAGSKLPLPVPETAVLADDLPAGHARTDYLRARLANGCIAPFSRQDSGMLAPLSQANALLINPAWSPAREAGAEAQYLRLE